MLNNTYKITARQVGSLPLMSSHLRPFLGKFSCAFWISKIAWSSGCCSRILREAQDWALQIRWEFPGILNALGWEPPTAWGQDAREMFLENHQQFIEQFSLLTCLWSQSCWKGLWYKCGSTSKISPARPPPSTGTEGNTLLNALKEKKKCQKHKWF